MKSKVTTNKKELINIVGNWSTAMVSVFYEFGSDEVRLNYGNKSVLYKSNSIKDVAYIALEFRGIGNDQYKKIALKQ